MPSIQSGKDAKGGAEHGSRLTGRAYITMVLGIGISSCFAVANRAKLHIPFRRFLPDQSMFGLRTSSFRSASLPAFAICTKCAGFAIAWVILDRCRGTALLFMAASFDRAYLCYSSVASVYSRRSLVIFLLWDLLSSQIPISARVHQLATSGSATTRQRSARHAQESTR